MLEALQGSQEALRLPYNRPRLPADARTDQIPARQRLSDLHRDRRRARSSCASTSDKVHGVPVERVVGSSIVTRYPSRERQARGRRSGSTASSASGLCRLRQLRGRSRDAGSGPRPGAGKRLGMLVLHDDVLRAYAYGPGQRPAGHQVRHVRASAREPGEAEGLGRDPHEQRLQQRVRAALRGEGLRGGGVDGPCAVERRPPAWRTRILRASPA